jgi:hypothetical protein
MSEDLINYGKNVPEVVKQSEHFQMMLNKSPEQAFIKQNRYADNSNYLPIGYIENLLDEVYSGLWSTTGKTEIHGNSVIAHVTLRVYHPIFKTWLTRYGVGAIPIQLNKGEKEMTFSTIKSDAFKKCEPAAKSQALRNAAQSLGKVFGRDLNRDDVPEYEPLSEQIANYPAEMAELLSLIDKSGYSEVQKQAMRDKAAKANIKEIVNMINKLKR